MTRSQQQYVVGFLADCNGLVLLVCKQRPEWQRGWLNGIGGKIEPGEDPAQAMAREWQEEVGGAPPAWRFFCELSGGGYVVHFYAATIDINIDDYLAGRAANDIGERFDWVPFDELGSHRVIPNLRWLLPLAFADASLPVATVRDQGIVTEAQHTEGASA